MLTEFHFLRPWWLLALLLVAIAVSFGAERAWPYDPAFNHDQGDRLRDTLHALVNESLNLLSIAAVPLLAAVWRFAKALP